MYINQNNSKVINILNLTPPPPPQQKTDYVKNMFLRSTQIHEQIGNSMHSTVESTSYIMTYVLILHDYLLYLIGLMYEYTLT